MNSESNGYLEKNLAFFMKRHKLPAHFGSMSAKYFVKFSEWVGNQLKADGVGAFTLGISGAQGTGKSTLSDFIQDYLRVTRGLTSVCLSIDDFYFTRDERSDLSRDVHPLLSTRGVPGTHDVQLALSILNSVSNLRPGDTVSIPRFNKAVDDRCGKNEWPVVEGAVDLIILEGWCIGAQVISESELIQPINDLEAKEDEHGIWRKYVNNQLESYAVLFDKLDALALLKAPDFESVYQWRSKQERKLASSESMSSKNKIMTDTQIAHFVQHFERVTLQNMHSVESFADVVMELGVDHQIKSFRIR